MDWVPGFHAFLRETYTKIGDENGSAEKLLNAIDDVAVAMQSAYCMKTVEGPSDTPEWFVHTATSHMTVGLMMWGTSMGDNEVAAVKARRERRRESARKRVKREAEDGEEVKA